MQKQISGLLLSLIIISGCAGMTDRQKTQTQGAAVGTGIGAIIGAGLGAIIGGADGAALGAALGAGTGLLAGTAYGTHVANQKAKFAREEDYLNAVIVSARQVNGETKQYNANLRKTIKEMDARTAQLKKKYQQRMIDKQPLADQKNKLEVELAEANKQLVKVKDELRAQKKALSLIEDRSLARLRTIEQEIKNLESSRAVLEEQVTKLAAIKSRVSV